MKLRLILVGLVGLLLINACGTSKPRKAFTTDDITVTFAAVSEDSNEYTVSGLVNSCFTSLTYSLNGADPVPLTLGEENKEDETKPYSFKIPLRKGNNTLVFKAEDTSSSAGPLTKTVTKEYTPLEPVLEVFAPDSPTSEQPATFKGAVSDNVTSVSYTHNGGDAVAIPLAEGQTQFEFDLTLVKGENTIVVTANDANPTTDASVQEVKVVYDPAVLAFTVLSPEATSQTGIAQETIKGFVGNNITNLTYVLNNGEAQPVTIAADKSFSFDVVLQKGSNTVVLTGDDTNPDTVAVSKELAITYNPAILALKVVEPTSPTQDETATIEGFVGEKVTTLSYVLNGGDAQAATIAADKSFSFDVTLQEGDNSIVLTADDEDANTDAVSATVNVTFTPVGESFLRVLHASPDAGLVNVLVDSTLVLENVAFDTLSSYLTLEEGQHRIEVNPVGSVGTVIDQTTDFAADTSYTLVVEGTLDSSDDADLSAKLLDIVPVDATKAKVQVIHSASNVDLVDVYITAFDAALDSAAPITLDYGQSTDVLEVVTGAYRARVTLKDSKVVIYDTGSLDLAAGNVYTIIATSASPVVLNLLTEDSKSVIPNVLDATKGTVAGYVANRRAGTPVAGSKVSIDGFGVVATTDAVGYYEFSVPAGYYTLNFNKEGSAGSKVDGLRVQKDTTTHHNLLQPEAFDPDMTTEPPQIIIDVDQGATLTGDADDLFSIKLSGTLSEPNTNSFYLSLAGIGATAGSSGYLNKYVPREFLSFNGTESEHVLSAAGFDGETTLHIVVYDQNSNRTEVVRYVTIVSNAAGASPIAPTEVFAQAVTLADIAQLGALSVAPSADVLVDALYYEEADAITALTESLQQVQTEGISSQGYLDESVSWVDISFKYVSATLPTAFEVFRKFENDPEPIYIGRIFAEDAAVRDTAGIIQSFEFRDSTPGLQNGQEVTYTIDAVSGGQRVSSASSTTKVLESFEVEVVSPSDAATFTPIQPVYTMSYRNASDAVRVGVIVLDRVQSNPTTITSAEAVGFTLNSNNLLQDFDGYVTTSGAAIPHSLLQALGRGRALEPYHTYDWQPVAMTSSVDDNGTPDDKDDDIVTAISVGSDYYNVFKAVKLPRFNLEEVPTATFTTGDGSF